MPKTKVYDYLDGLEISYRVHEHEPVFTCESAARVDRELRGAHSKNLFLRDRPGTRHFLISVVAEKKVDLQALRRLSQIDCSKLSFGSAERLKERLHLTAGSVSPFGLLNDPEQAVEFFIDEDLLTAEFVNFHPNLNDATVELTPADFVKYLKSLGREIVPIKISELTD